MIIPNTRTAHDSNSNNTESPINIPAMANPLKEKVFLYATKTLGFDDCRFANPHLGEAIRIYKHWLKENHYGDMAYLKNHLKFKENPDLLLAGVKSSIVLIKNYKNTKERRLKNIFKIARYAVGKDYHVVMRERLDKLIHFMKTQNSGMECYAGVDSSPLPERSLAIKSGIGFLGKNSMVIKPGLGSYFFIGVVLTTHDFESDKPLSWNCGQCRLCIDACPTQAIMEQGAVNATRCISYQTIEQKAPMSNEDITKAGGWLFGCDICQEVCPYNHDNTPLTNWIEFLPEAGTGFDFFEKNNADTTRIPKTAPLYRSRSRVIPNWKTAISVSKKQC